MKKIIITLIVLIIICSILLIGNTFFNNKKVSSVILNDDLSVGYLEDVKLSSLIKCIDGTYDDILIDTSMLGANKVSFNYRDVDGNVNEYSFLVNVVDKTPPVFMASSNYSIYVGDSSNFTKNVFCGDNLDDKPNCHIVGEYDYNTPGEYPLVYEAVDKSGNVSTKKITLKVKEKTKSSSSSPSVSSSNKKTKFGDIIKEYKNDKTKIGIDVSKWDQDINFQKVKDAGVEFVFIKMGGTIGSSKRLYVDPYFKKNIEGFQKVGIPVGIYFYSYATSPSFAIKEANYLLDNIKGYEFDLPIAFDWEVWDDFNKMNISFDTLTKSAKAFIDTVEASGYKGCLYSSKNYLEKIWLKNDFEVWLAHYTNKTNYKGSYKYWQMTSEGVIDGIKGTVDVDIMYVN